MGIFRGMKMLSEAIFYCVLL